MSGDVEALTTEIIAASRSMDDLRRHQHVKALLATQIAAAEQRGREELREKCEALAATWECDSLGGDRYCAAELRDLLKDQP